MNELRKYTRKEAIDQLRELEAYARSRPVQEQTLGLEAAVLGSLLGQAASMLSEYQKPALSGNRLLTMAELLTLYDTDAHHSWPSHSAPFLYLEDRAGAHQWISWQQICDCLAGADASAPEKDAYLVTWRLWLCKPTPEDCQATPWE